MLQTDAEEPEADLTRPASPRFGHDFSRIPVHPPAAGAIQAKLAINRPGDAYEQEADRIADEVMAAEAHPVGRDAPPRIQRFRGQAVGQVGMAPPRVHRALASPGRPLEPALRQDMEQRFGYDFSQVRVHFGSVAAESAREVNARAYTVGANIVFGAGQLTPGTHEGRRLIAHELTHVVQQSGADGVGVAVQRQPTEAEALQALAEAERVLQQQMGVAQDYIESKGGKPGKPPGRPSVDRPQPGVRRLPSRDWLNRRLIEIAAGGDPEARKVMDGLADAAARDRQAQRDLTAARGGATTPFKAPTTTKTPTTKTPVKEPPITVPTEKPLPTPGPAPTPAPVVERPPSPVVAPPDRPTSAWKAGLKAGGKALGFALIFAGLGYLVHRKLGKDLDESIDKARHGVMPWAQRLKRDDPSKPVYMRVMVESRDYSRYAPFLGWMPETPVLHMIQIAMVREEIDPPVVEVRDERLNVWRPGVTTTVTYTELMVP